jgi:hypothetical protein
MSDTPVPPAGLLTDEEAQRLTESDTDQLSDDLRGRVRERLADTLRDLSVLYPTLPAADLRTVFSPTEDAERRDIRAATQDGLALLVLGMLIGDDDVELRLRDAIVNAGLSHGEDIDITLNLRRGPLPTLEQFAARVDNKGLTNHTYPLFEHFLTQADTDPDTIEVIAEEMGFDLTAADHEEMQDALAPYARTPQTIVTDISVTERPSYEEDYDL